MTGGSSSGTVAASAASATGCERGWKRSSAPGLAGDRRAPGPSEGIVLGDDAELTDGLKTSFRRRGLYHLLAVSGQNVVLLAAGALALRPGRRVCPAGLVMSVRSGRSASTWWPWWVRSRGEGVVASGVAVSAAWLMSRERDPWHALLLAAVLLLGWNPYTMFDPGFQLSFAAVVAIFVAVGPVTRRLEGYPVPPKVAMATAVSAVCSVATAPIRAGSGFSRCRCWASSRTFSSNP